MGMAMPSRRARVAKSSSTTTNTHDAQEEHGLLPILLARTRQHNRDHHHGRDEWVSGDTGKMVRSRLVAKVFLLSTLQWQSRAPRVCVAFVGELHAACSRGTPTLPALELRRPNEKGNLMGETTVPWQSQNRPQKSKVHDRA